jgi:myo-inositol-1(or 4)-monophosphatase
MTTAIAAVREAGDMIAARAGSIGDVIEKRDRSLVTDLDHRSDALLRRVIGGRFPGHALLTEESGWSGSGDYCWIIDPLDGTHNFIRGLDLFGVQLAILHKGAFVGSVIYLPAVEKLYAAESGSGAYVNETRLRVSPRTSLAACTLSFDSGLKRESERKLDVLRILADEVFNIRMFGASCILLSLLAQGSIDCAIEFDEKPWDFAPGVCLITEAGGAFTTHAGQAPTMEMRAYVASNGLVHAQALKLLHK